MGLLEYINQEVGKFTKELPLDHEYVIDVSHAGDKLMILIDRKPNLRRVDHESDSK